MPNARKIIYLGFVFLTILTPLVFLPNTSELFEFNKIIITYLFTTLIVSAWISRMIWEKRLIFRRSLLDWPLLVFLLIQLVSLLFSIDPRSSLMGYYSRFNGGFLSLLCYSLLYWAAVSNLDRKSVLGIIRWTLFSAFLVAIWGFLQHLGIDAHLWVQDVKTRVFSTLGQPNWLAAYLVALIFIPLSQSISSKNFQSLILSGSYTLLLFIVLLFTKSRSGLLAYGISFVVFSAIYLKQLGKLEIRSIKNLLFVSLLTLTLTLTIKNPIRDLVFSKFNLSTEHLALSTTSPSGTSLETGGTESGIIRKIVWTGAVRIWQSSTKNLLLGSGPETFAMAYYQFRPLEHNQTSEWELLYNKSHNEFLNYLSTTGLLGLISYLVLLGFMLKQLVTAHHQTSSEHSALNAALVVGWLSISITNFWGFSVVIVQIFLFLLPAFAITLHLDPIPPPAVRKSTWQTYAILFSCSLTLVLFYSISRYWYADVLYAAGQKDFKAFNATQDPEYILSSYHNFVRAFDLNPIDPPISSDLSVSAAFMALLASSSPTSSASSQLIEISQMASRRAISVSPLHPNYYKTRSRSLVILGTLDPVYYQQSDQALATAQLISPTDPRIPYIRGINAKYAGQPESAAAFFRSALTLKPEFADAVTQLKNLSSSP